MSDIMRPISADALINWVLTENKNESSIFGVRKYFYADPTKTMTLFGEKMETPFGPAAGPHTQLAQNIIASYISGSRFFELKTVQIIDGEDLPVAKPCINASDECYNVEWSTELRVPIAFEEYAKAWFVIKLLSKEFGFGDPDGFIFNMSVGYDLEGIKSQKIQDYINNMVNAEGTPVWEECKTAAKKYLSRFENIDEDYIENISPKVSRSITLSTLHGCPPAEIERIATYLLEEKGLNTFIKCNPTLLGYEFARKAMDDHGFDYMVFDDHHFKADLQYEDAVPMLQRLQKLADGKELAFGVKLTNTFPVGVGASELPGEEMYMSGRSLFPLSIALAKRLSDTFDGKLQISYSGGADIFNIKSIFDTGIWPITVATTLLKPGGYQRLDQMAHQLANCEYPTEMRIDRQKLDALVERSKTSTHYHKPIKPVSTEERKLSQPVPLTDCYTAPCRGGCPIQQDIPAYLRLVDEGKHLEALRVIVDKNPLPFITGTICAHPCMTKCTRAFYEDSIHIRSVKLEAATHAYDELMATMTKPIRKENAPKTAVVGGGPAGIAAGYLLAREGMPVTVFERGDQPGGVCAQIVPEFRISMESVLKDVEMAKFMGAEFICGKPAPSLEELREMGYTNVIYAIGAWKHGKLRLEAGEAINSLQFLIANRKNTEENVYGENIVVIGGGNTAMDCARAATRIPGVKKVRLVYRRDRRNMPADEEELYLALEDNVEFCELLAPIRHENNILTCEKMKLGARDASGRRSPEGTGEIVEIPADCLIAAVGEKVETEFYQSIGIQTDNYGKVVNNYETLETNLKDVYVIGDANLGPATIVEAIADATKAANNIVKVHNHHYEQTNINDDVTVVRNKRGIVLTCDSTRNQAGRCLECSTICESCMDVCPNRANVVVEVKGKPQIVHVDRMCNECGNCETFCPYASAPYKDKFTLFNTEDDFYNSTNNGYYLVNAETKECLVRLWDNVLNVNLNNPDSNIPTDLVDLMNTMVEQYSFYLCM